MNGSDSPSADKLPIMEQQDDPQMAAFQDMLQEYLTSMSVTVESRDEADIL